MAALARVQHVLLSAVASVLMLLLSETTIERVAPLIVLRSQGDFVPHLFSCECVIRLLLVALALHVVRHERPGPFAVTMCLGNLAILQIWLMETTSWDEALAYRLSPLAMCMGIFVAALIIDIALSGVVREVVLIATGASILSLAHYITRWNMLMMGYTSWSAYQWGVFLGTYVGVLLYLGVLAKVRASRRDCVSDAIAT